MSDFFSGVDLEKSLAKIECFRKKILDHLSQLEAEEEKTNKTLVTQETKLQKAGFPVGTIRTWNGKQHIKVADGEWKPKYDGHTTGAKMAISAIKKKITAAKDEHEMMQIILKNRDRFIDKEGHPLPFVQELHEHIKSQQAAREKTEEKPEAEVVLPGGKITLNLKDNIHTILYGSNAEKEKLKGQFFHLADTPEYLKECGLSGDYFSVKYGVISRHTGKDKEHSLSENNWSELCDAITKPFAVAKHGEGYRLFTSIKSGGSYIAVGVDVKTIGEGLEVNSVCTAFSYNQRNRTNEEIIYKSKKITPDQAALLDGLNSLSLPPVQGSTSNIPQSGEKSSGFEAIQEKYQSAKAIEGDDDELAVGKETIAGKWKLVEADTPTASHDETTFHKTEGFPTNEDGSTINDRDYERDAAAQEAVIEIASDYDMQALSMDSPVIVTQDGVVISGNNRTMSSKIAAKKGTDKKYIEGLKKKAKKFGFTAEQVGQFMNPRVVFEVENNDGYSTKQFAKFNESNKKAMNPIESAVKVSKMMKSAIVENIAQKVGEFDTLGELYADKRAANDIFNTLQKDGIIGQFDRPQYVTDEGITGAGKEFLETVLIGSVINEQNIRGLNREGCKSIRQKLVRAITPLIENKGMNGYSITEELNRAVNIAMQVAINKDQFNSVEEYSQQQNMFEEDDKISVELAKRLEGTQKDFAEFMQTVNGGLKYAANGEADIFLGGVETKEDILSRFFELKKALIDSIVDGAIGFFNLIKDGKAKFEKRKVVLNRAGENVDQYRWIDPDDPIQAISMNSLDCLKKQYQDGWIFTPELLDILTTKLGSREKAQDIINEWDSLGVDMLALEKQGIAPYADPKPDNGTANTQKTIAIDFDGVINSYKNGWQGATATDEPVLSAAESISGLFNRGYKLVIFSTRAQSPEGIETIREYLRKHAENDLLADSIEITDKKPIADCYIDDRAIPFNGDWKETLEKIETFKPWVEKSLTYSGYPLEGRTKVHGMDISIENKKGSTRSGTDKDGHEWKCFMHNSYGYIRGTVGVDKDHLDAYIGPNPESEIVYIVNQNDPVTGKFDEQKVMLGFNSEAEAKAAYLKQYDRPGFLGDIVKMDIDTFKAEAFNPKNKGKPLEKRVT